MIWDIIPITDNTIFKQWFKVVVPYKDKNTGKVHGEVELKIVSDLVKKDSGKAFKTVLKDIRVLKTCVDPTPVSDVYLIECVKYDILKMNNLKIKVGSPKPTLVEKSILDWSAIKFTQMNMHTQLNFTDCKDVLKVRIIMLESSVIIKPYELILRIDSPFIKSLLNHNYAAYRTDSSDGDLDSDEDEDDDQERNDDDSSKVYYDGIYIDIQALLYDYGDYIRGELNKRMADQKLILPPTEKKVSVIYNDDLRIKIRE